MPYTWSLYKKTTEKTSARGIEWDEVWHVEGFVQGNDPAWPSILTDRPAIAYGQPHASVTGAYVDDLEIVPLGDTDSLTVTVKYLIAFGGPAIGTNPWDRPARITVTSESVEVPTFEKADGTPWVNTAGDLIQGLTRTENHIVFNISKDFEASTYPAWLLTYADAANDDTFSIKSLSISPHYAMLLRPLFGEDQTEQVNGVTVSYVTGTFQIAYNPRTWKTKVYSRGLYQLVSGKRVPCLDDDGDPMTEPVFLDANGVALPYPLNPANVVTVEGWNHELKPFAALPLT